MGNCHFKTEFETENVTGKNIIQFLQKREHVIHISSLALTKNNFNYQYCIGKGGFGKVWKVDRKKSKQQYAMKEMSKARIITKRSVKSVMNERQILTQLNNPFIVNMYYAFQDRENLYLVMDLLNGGDLRYHICRHRRFTEE
jgi:serine/threonine protein kinase